MNDAERELKSRGTVSHKFTIPMLFAEEWFEDCRLNFNNTYHLKMQFDHEFRKQFNATANLLIIDIADLREEIFELKAKIAELESNGMQNKQEKKVKTFGE